MTHRLVTTPLRVLAIATVLAAGVVGGMGFAFASIRTGTE